MIALSKSMMATRLLCRRLLHTNSAEKSPLFKLRQKTGLAYNLCREALNKHDNDVDEAEAWLKAHALAHGIQKASKVRDRSTREGLVCLSVPHDNSRATVVELNCETDFVARNQIFKDFAIGITEQISAELEDSEQYRLPDGHDLIEGRKPNEKRVEVYQNQIAPVIAKLGENIRLARAFQVSSADLNNATRIFGQVHAQSAKKTTDSLDIAAGRFGSIVALRLEHLDQDANKLRAIGNRLCQHVIGFSPSYIELPDNIRKQLEAIEKEKSERKSDSGEQEEGYSDSESSQSSNNSRDEWPSLMDQSLIMTEDLSVKDFCKGNNVSVLYFNRIECGMES